MNTDDTATGQKSAQDEQRLRGVARVAGPQRSRRSRGDWAGEPAAIYCRISHVNDDDQTGVERQERLCRDTAERLKLTIPPELVFVDNNRSAWRRTRKRPGWDALLEATRDGKVRHVLTYHPDRLMRQPRDLEELLQIADDQDITLHGQANQRDLSDPDDRFFLRIEVAHACRSSDDTSRRLSDAMIERAQDGRPHTGKRRYGYDKTGMEPIPAEAKIVRDVFTRYVAGETPDALASDLNERGEKTALGKAWSPHRILDLLDNRHVAGIRVFRGEEIGNGEWPAIIDRGLWNEVREHRSYRASAWAMRTKPARFYLLRGVITCKGCGTRMAGTASKQPAYTCTRHTRRDEAQCGRKIAAKKTEEFVKDAAIRLLENLDVNGQEANISTAMPSEDAEAIQADRAELAELKEMWDAQEIKTREYRQMRKVVEDRIAKRERKTVVRPALEVLEGLVGPHARESWGKLETAGNVQRLNAVIRFLFAAVIVDEATGKRGVFDYGRIDIDPNPL
ncbi:recombinase family protein [Streptomyces sp. PH10-H1]|uniref:recombinase family protein n=1 Tax=Streptomyces sp. PH10-H1 TaxID=3046212 RepID=UPI0024BA37DE|nr:recombinase family protein [Streptomyces sp. PH10-H1]MDJ0342510.1 recombinase family protein [Streptomyces sp. PH10-H1]